MLGIVLRCSKLQIIHLILILKNWDMEKLSKLPKATQPVKNRAGIQTQAIWFQDPHS